MGCTHTRKADGGLRRAWHGGPGDRQRDPCGRRHESRLPRVGDAGTRRACSRHGQPKGSRLTLPKPRDQCLSHVVARRTALRASVSPGEGKVSPRRWERAHEQKRYLTWAAEMMPAVNDGVRCKGVIVPAGPRRQHTSIRKLIAARKRSKDAPFRRCRAPALLAQRSGDTLVCARAF